MAPFTRFLSGAVMIAGIMCVGAWQHADSSPPSENADPSPASRQGLTELKTLDELIGTWRGTGQVRRGSTQGAWRETGEFVWDFSGQTPAVRYAVTDGKHVAEVRLTWDADAKVYRAQMQGAAGEMTDLTGQWEDGRLVLTSPPDEDGVRRRMTITPLNEKRTLVLHEKTSPSGTLFSRVAEVGYTREGTRLAAGGTGQRECVVTGGTGTMTVSYKGETYYVCCSGCRQAFEDDPEGVLADFRERLKRRTGSPSPEGSE